MAGVLEFIIKMQDGLSGTLGKVAVSSTTARGALDKLTASSKELKSMSGEAAAASQNLISNLSKLNSLKTAMPEAVSKGFEAIKSSLPEGVESAFGSIAGILTNPFVVAGAALSSAYVYGLKSKTEREDFSKILGVDAGSKVYADVKKLRKFLGEDAISGGKSLIDAGTGADKIAPMLAKIGDVAGGSKEKFNALTGAFAQVQKDGKLTTDTLSTLTENGFKPLTLLQSKFGGTAEAWQKKLNDGTISAADLSKALETATEKGGVFNGKLLEFSNTPTGIWNIITDKVKGFAETFGEKLLPIVDKGTELLGKGMTWLFGIVNQGVDLFMTLATFVGNNADLFYALAGGVGAMVIAYEAFQAYQVISYMWMMRESVGASFLAVAKGGLAVVTGLLTTAQWALNAAFIASPIGWIVVGLGLLVGGIIYAWKHFEGFRKVVYGLWETFKSVFTSIGNLFKQIFSPISEAIKAIQEHRWSDAAKATGQLMFNLSPVGFAMATKDFAKGGGFDSVSGAYGKGEAKGSASWKADHEKKDAKKTTVESKQKDYAASGIDKKGGAGVAAGVDAVSGGGVKNIQITVGKMVETMTITIVGGTKEMADEIERKMEEILVRAIASAANR
jgi:tape measure domain-containing protein